MSSAEQQRKKLHPHKFTLWVGIASIIMMFAGLTSAYIVKRDQPGWTGFTMPLVFWYSTAVMLLSSLTMQLGLKAFKERERNKYKNLVSVPTVLGILFVVLQVVGYNRLHAAGIKIEGSGAGVFFIIIFGLHAAHVLGGIVALLLLLFKAFSGRTRSYNPVPVEVVATYWHFVDILWIYLFIFFCWIQ